MLFPAPFSPTMACNWPAVTSTRNVVQGHHPREAFRHALKGNDRNVRHRQAPALNRCEKPRGCSATAGPRAFRPGGSGTDRSLSTTAESSGSSPILAMSPSKIAPHVLEVAEQVELPLQLRHVDRVVPDVRLADLLEHAWATPLACRRMILVPLLGLEPDDGPEPLNLALRRLARRPLSPGRGFQEWLGSKPKPDEDSQQRRAMPRRQRARSVSSSWAVPFSDTGTSADASETPITKRSIGAKRYVDCCHRPCIMSRKLPQTRTAAQPADPPPARTAIAINNRGFASTEPGAARALSSMTVGLTAPQEQVTTCPARRPAGSNRPFTGRPGGGRRPSQRSWRGGRGYRWSEHRRPERSSPGGLRRRHRKSPGPSLLADGAQPIMPRLATATIKHKHNTRLRPIINFSLKMVTLDRVGCGKPWPAGD